jgi:D-sedoheptulose 7-phosphate isomerase
VSGEPLPCGRAHLDQLRGVLDALAERADQIDGWGRALADVLVRGGRLLAVGNGGSAAEAQHLTAEIVGRYRDDRPPFSAIALHAETSAMTAIGNDYGIEEMFARQVRAHGRPGDVLLALSTSGASPNVLAAAEAAIAAGMTVWALTGPAGSPLCGLADEAVCVDTPHTATVQEAHLVAIHMLCAAFDCALGDMGVMGAARGGRFQPSARMPGSRV